MSSAAPTNKVTIGPKTERERRFKERVLQAPRTPKTSWPSSSSAPSMLDQLRKKLREEEEDQQTKTRQMREKQEDSRIKEERDTLLGEVDLLKRKKEELETYLERLGGEIKEAENNGRKVVREFLKEVIDRLTQDAEE